ncbi:hypothetical protein [Pseudomonas sp. TTU2014-080ASC]|uniref:hypothetical protein n=1 Tax=Pseudomonas sp. TTU2014-080ASC TaxID=1729724 RepID=UPI00128FA5BA|nr:hypothetical protein [Pseudomonas sp. TTU2014-080ASC]
MSSLLFYTNENEAIVATDTLLHYPEGGAPGFTSKAVTLPHLRMIIAATGSALLFNRWIGLVNNEGTAFDVDTIDAHAPEALKALWRELNNHSPALNNQTATIYHFGFSNDSGVIHGYAYRSVSSFKSEQLSCGLGVKPDLQDHSGIDWPSFPSSAPDIMRAQARQEDAKKFDRVYIGGSVQVTHLTRTGFTIYSLGELD